MPNTQDTTSSSDKNKSTLNIADEEEDEPVVKKVDANKLGLQHLIDFGFNLKDEANKNPGKWDGGKGGDEKSLAKAANAAKRARSNKNQTVVYGADLDDADNDFNDDQDIYDEPDAILDVDSDEDAEGAKEEPEEEEELNTGTAEKPGYFDEYSEADDMWEDEDEDEGDEEGEGEVEDEEELERQRQEAFEAAMLAADEERERIREMRLAEIMKKKEVLIERYLRVARVMISHRKKNIYLQDYLYHLAHRKGVLRGDSSLRGASNASDSEESVLSKAMKQRQHKKNALMASRFGRFLRKTGHFYEDPDSTRHHHRNNPSQNPHSRPNNVNKKSSHALNSAISHRKHNHHTHFTQSVVPKTMIRKHSKTCADTDDGHCPPNRKGRATIKKLHKHHSHTKKLLRNTESRKLSVSSKNRSRTPGEILERKAQKMMQKAMSTATDALEQFEHHRCKMAKKNQLIKITKLLERHYSGISLLEQERNHLVSFVEVSVKAQNLAKRKAMKRLQKNKTENKMGAVNLNHQWVKSLERIRELRLKKEKLEQEERLVLIRKVKHWNIWEKRNTAAMEGVYEFVTDMASRVIMTKGETLGYRTAIEQFRKQLCTLHKAMLSQVVKKHKAQNLLFMAQRHAKDNTSVAAPVKGFTITDYERMSIENQESHQKLMERQEHLVVQYDKLKKYVQQVADFHLKKQRSWGTLRTGKHDMKQLWELCLQERDGLLRKIRDIQTVSRLHRKLFMQISVVENKRLFKDFQRVTRRVEELLDIERNLQTELHQVQSLARILNVKYLDTQSRNNEAERQKTETLTRKSLQMSRDTIKERIAPRVPNTVYNVNIHSLKSQAEILEAQRQKPGIPRRQKQKD